MIQLNPTILREDGKEKFVVLPWEDFLRMREALEDADDLRLLRGAKQADEAGGEPRLTLEEVAAQLGVSLGEQPRET